MGILHGCLFFLPFYIFLTCFESLNDSNFDRQKAKKNKKTVIFRIGNILFTKKKMYTSHNAQCILETLKIKAAFRTSTSKRKR